MGSILNRGKNKAKKEGIPKNYELKSNIVEVHDDGEGNWLVSYADMMTLLWGFFVILTIFSTPDASKFEKLKEHTSQAMGGTYERPLNELTDELKDVFNQMNIDQDIRIESLVSGLKLTASSTRFFGSGEASLGVQAKSILENIGKTISQRAAGYKIIIEGHTDDVPISTRKFPSNWELSLRRASEVVRLFEKLGIPHEDLRPVGLSDIEPLEKIESLSGVILKQARAKNRRIVIRVQKQMKQPTKQINQLETDLPPMGNPEKE